MRFVKYGRGKIRAADKRFIPGFSGGGEWFNSNPISREDLEQKVVLVSFWSCACNTCCRTLPYFGNWWDRYKDRDFVMVGVHTPEFEFEDDIERLRKAIQEYGVEWPVVHDNGYRIFKSFGNHFWPHRYLADKKGEIVYDFVGEGAYQETEDKIEALL